MKITAIKMSMVIIFIGLLYRNSTAQSIKPNQFRMVKVDPKIKKQLYMAIINAGEIDSPNDGVMLISELIKKDALNNYTFVDGIYAFKINGPHFKPYIFYKIGDKTDIVQDYNLSKLLEQVSMYIKLKKTPLKEQLMYVQSIVNIMKIRNNINF